MAQHDYNVANQGFALFRADMNLAFAAVQSNNSGPSAPATTTAFMWWYDTTNNILKIRNAANTAWIDIGFFDQAAARFRPIVREIRAADSNGIAIQNSSGVSHIIMDDSGRVGIGSAASAAASLEINSTTRGFRAPRMTTVQRNAIASPGAGLLVYDTDLAAYVFHNGASWQTIGGGVSGLTLSNFNAATIVTEAEGIGSNDNDTTFPTSAAVKDYVDTVISSSPTRVSLPNTSVSANYFTFDVTGVDHEVHILLDGIRLSTSGGIAVQLADSGGYEVTGYASEQIGMNGTTSYQASGSLTSSGVQAGLPLAVGGVIGFGIVTVRRASGNFWTVEGVLSTPGGGGSIISHHFSGYRQLDGDLIGVRVGGAGGAVPNLGTGRGYFI